MEDSNKKIYELGYHVMPTLSEEELAKVVEGIKGTLTSMGAEVIADKYPESMKLAYDVVKEIDNKNRSFDTAYFGWVKFELEAASLEAFAASIDKNPSILRSILIKTVRENTFIGTRMMQSRAAGQRRTQADSDAAPMDAAVVDQKIDELVEGDTSLREAE